MRKGYIYLLHFSRPISDKHTCQHYVGWAKNLAARIQSHEVGNGARLTQVAKERGITFKVVRVWRGNRYAERRLKRHSNNGRFCPVCNSKPKTFKQPELSKQEIQAELLGF